MDKIPDLETTYPVEYEGRRFRIRRRDEQPEEIPIAVIEIRAQLALRKAMDFLEEQGFFFNQTPTIIFADHDCQQNPGAIMSVAEEGASMVDFVATLGPSISGEFLKRFGLSVSDEALQEEAVQGKKAMELLLKEREEYYTRGAITIYRSIRHKLGKMEEMMVHELWHLIEQQQGVFNSIDFIHEGTAVFVQQLYANQLDQPWISEDPYNQLLYGEASRIVKEVLSGTENPLRVLMRSEVREEIKKRVKTHLADSVIPALVDNIFQYRTQAVLAGMKKTKEYSEFIENPTTENYLLAYRKFGFHKAASELQQQNLEPLIEFYRRLLRE